MAIPPLNAAGELPAGEHEADLTEIESRFGSANEQRRRLMAGLKAAADNLARANVRKIWIDGSFVTDKVHPNDIDGVWETSDLIDEDVLDTVFLGSRAAMKAKYGLDFFPDVIEAGSGLPFPLFFQTNRDDQPKGIVVLKLEQSDDPE